MIQSDIAPAEVLGDHPVSSLRRIRGTSRYALVEMEEPVEVKHARNVKGSELLLRRLTRHHYEHAPQSYKNRFLPTPLRNVLVSEYIRLDAERRAEIEARVTPPVTSDTLPSDVLDLAGAVAEVDEALLYYHRIPMRLLVAVVGKYYKIKPLGIVSKSREQQICHARHVVFYLAKEIVGYSFTEIGRRIGDRDHTTVISGYRKMLRMLDSEPRLRVQIETLRAQIIQQYELLTAPKQDACGSDSPVVAG